MIQNTTTAGVTATHHATTKKLDPQVMLTPEMLSDCMKFRKKRSILAVERTQVELLDAWEHLEYEEFRLQAAQANGTQSKIIKAYKRVMKAMIAVLMLKVELREAEDALRKDTVTAGKTAAHPTTQKPESEAA